MSPSSRRAWIEIANLLDVCVKAVVALLAEGVDRNMTADSRLTLSVVALLAEGVDRNPSPALMNWAQGWSPSSRRAWIEI